VTAVPEVPNLARCHYVGPKASVGLQVTGIEFGAPGAAAPGGFITHYDCRTYEVEPLHLFTSNERAVILGGFGTTNIAYRAIYPFIVVFRTSPEASP
jgi:hypothetical protein